MRMMDIEMRTWYGAPAYFVLGAVHAVIFWVAVSLLTPLVLLVALFNDRRRLLHDMLGGTWSSTTVPRPGVRHGRGADTEGHTVEIDLTARSRGRC